MAVKKRAAKEGGVFKMEVKVLEKGKEDKVSFILSNTDVEFANMLRRYMIEEVPVMAIEDVEFRKNNSILYDEIVAHRLGLIPLKTDLKSYNILEECKCKGKGCARCSLKMTLSAKGQKIVYAGEIKSKDPKIKPVHQKTPIVKLLKGQDIELEASAVLGKGKEHIKWSPCVVYYKYKPVIELTNKCNNCGECIEKCPQKVFEMKNNKVVVNKNNLLKCHLCNACLDICKKGGINKEEKSNEFVFYVESFGQLSCKEIIIAALDEFEKKIKMFTNGIKKVK